MARAILIVLDSVGIGAMDDAYLFGDEGSHTLKHTAEAVGGLNLPNMENLGLGHIDELQGVARQNEVIGSFGRMKEQANGKDTTTGHWEMMGHILYHAFPTFPNGFPVALIEAFERRIGRKTLGNIVASGTVIIEELGREHMKTGFPIVYTSADSVFQIAAHEEIIPLEDLYKMCQDARELLQGEWGVGRVIARPFVGQPGHFARTSNRHDYSLMPGRTYLDLLTASGYTVAGIGKIKDIFAGQGVTCHYPSKNNQEGMDQILLAMKEHTTGLIFANLVDFDMVYGHRNNAKGYAEALEDFDKGLEVILDHLLEDDLLVITADHGCDPTTVSTDHSREYVPLLVYGKKYRAGVDLKVRQSFADLGATIVHHMGVRTDHNLPGESFCDLLRK